MMTTDGNFNPLCTLTPKGPSDLKKTAMTSPETEGERIEKSVTHVCRAGQHEGNGTGRTANMRKMKYQSMQIKEEHRYERKNKMERL